MNSLQKPVKKIINYSKIAAVLVAFFVFAPATFAAWQDPTAAPPQNNPPGFIQNISDINGASQTGNIKISGQAIANILSATSQICLGTGTGSCKTNWSEVSGLWQPGASGAIYYNGGRVGVGIQTPSYKLHVVGGSTDNGLAVSGNTYAIYGAASNSSGVGVYGYSGGAGGIAVRASGGNYGIYSAAGKNYFVGNVGIGRSVPGARLEVDGDIAIDANSTNNGSYGPNMLRFGGAGSGEGIGSARVAESPNLFGLDFYTGLTTGGVRMSITNRGDVGIGTINPAAKLEVAGKTKIIGGTEDNDYKLEVIGNKQGVYSKINAGNISGTYSSDPQNWNRAGYFEATGSYGAKVWLATTPRSINESFGVYAVGTTAGVYGVGGIGVQGHSANGTAVWGRLSTCESDAFIDDCSNGIAVRATASGLGTAIFADFDYIVPGDTQSYAIKAAGPNGISAEALNGVGWSGIFEGGKGVRVDGGMIEILNGSTPGIKMAGSLVYDGYDATLHIRSGGDKVVFDGGDSVNVGGPLIITGTGARLYFAGSNNQNPNTSLVWTMDNDPSLGLRFFTQPNISTAGTVRMILNENDYMGLTGSGYLSVGTGLSARELKLLPLTQAPANTTSKLYSIENNLFWNGQQISTGSFNEVDPTWVGGGQATGYISRTGGVGVQAPSGSGGFMNVMTSGPGNGDSYQYSGFRFGSVGVGTNQSLWQISYRNGNAPVYSGEAQDLWFSYKNTANQWINPLIITESGLVGMGAYPGATLRLKVSGRLGAGSYCNEDETDCKTATEITTGAGTINQVSKWTSSRALGNSIIVDDGTNVGIGIDPTHKLTVSGFTRLDVSGTSYDVWIQGGSATTGGDARNLAVLGLESSDRLYLNYNNEYKNGTFIQSNLNIGTSTVVSDARLHIRPMDGQEGIRIISASNWSPINIRNSANTADIFRVSQTGVLDVGSIPYQRITGATTNGYVLKYNGSSWAPAADAGITTSVSGVTNYIPKFTGANTVGNSNITDDGNDVSVPKVNASLILGDGGSQTMRLLGGYSGGATIQVGANSSDDAGILNIARRGSTNYRIDKFNVYAAESYFSGRVRMGYEIKKRTCYNYECTSPTCSANYQVIGGGCNTSEGAQIEESYPGSNGDIEAENSWHCHQNKTDKIIVYAICTRISD